MPQFKREKGFQHILTAQDKLSNVSAQLQAMHNALRAVGLEKLSRDCGILARNVEDAARDIQEGYRKTLQGDIGANNKLLGIALEGVIRKGEAA